MYTYGIQYAYAVCIVNKDDGGKRHCPRAAETLSDV